MPSIHNHQKIFAHFKEFYSQEERQQVEISMADRMMKSNIMMHLYKAIIFQNNPQLDKNPDGVEKKENPKYESMFDGPLGVCSFEKFSAFWTEVFKFLESFEMKGQ